MKDTKKLPVIGVIWKVAFNSLKTHPVILLPFCISGILKLLGLFIIFIAIFYPLSIVFGPIIKTLWGETFLHYPFNFSLMPKLFYYVQIAVYIFLDGLFSGMAVWMVSEVNQGRKPVFKESLKNVLPKYVTLTAFLLSIFLIVHFISHAENLLILKSLKLRFIALLMKKGILDFIKVFFNFFIIVVIESLFAFVMPFVVLANKRYFRAIGASLSLVKKLFFAAFLLIAVPTLITLPFSLLKTGLAVLVSKTTLPEITLLVLGLSAVIVALVDCIVTVSLTFLFLLRKDLAVEKVK